MVRCEHHVCVETENVLQARGVSAASTKPQPASHACSDRVDKSLAQAAQPCAPTHQAHNTTCDGSDALTGGMLTRDKYRSELRRLLSAAGNEEG